MRTGSKASAALDDAFSPAVPDGVVLFEFAVTKAWLRQLIVALALIGRGSYRGIAEFVRDLLGMAISIGCVHDVLQAATRQASAINRGQDLSGIRVGLHDEIFQGATPVLAGVDAASTYCYILAGEDRRDADTWGVHLLAAAEEGLRPDYTIADAGQGLRAGQRAAWGDVPCHGDVFHNLRQGEGLANGLVRLAQGATSRRKVLQIKSGRAGQRAPDHEFAAQLQHERKAETQSHQLAGDVRTLVRWLRQDVLTLAGPDMATRQELFDFLVSELAAREPEDTRRIRPVRVALQNQRDHLLAFAGQLDAKSAVIAHASAIPELLVRRALMLRRLSAPTSATCSSPHQDQACHGRRLRSPPTSRQSRHPPQAGQAPRLRPRQARPAQGPYAPCCVTPGCTEAADEPRFQADPQPTGRTEQLQVYRVDTQKACRS